MSQREFGVIQTADPQMKKIIMTANNIAPSRATVLIQGESGCGKELLARYIHSHSPRSGKKLVAINCAAVPEGLLESELFGFEKGAFTGADQRKLGKFEMANDSTFLLDEVSEMPLLLQAKLLRVLQEGEVERLGGSGPTKINVRLIATTNRDLSRMVREGQFREDLYYRLNVVPLTVPPLRQRPKDVELLARLFLEMSSADNGLPAKSLSVKAIDRLQLWRWPGNVRELQNVIERTVLLSSSEVIDASDVMIQSPTSSDGARETEDVEVRSLKPGMTVGEAERWLIMKTLEATNQNRTKAAQMLGISIRTLRNKINEYKFQPNMAVNS